VFCTAGIVTACVCGATDMDAGIHDPNHRAVHLKAGQDIFPQHIADITKTLVQNIMDQVPSAFT